MRACNVHYVWRVNGEERHETVVEPVAVDPRTIDVYDHVFAAPYGADGAYVMAVDRRDETVGLISAAQWAARATQEFVTFPASEVRRVATDAEAFDVPDETPDEQTARHTAHRALLRRIQSEVFPSLPEMGK